MNNDHPLTSLPVPVELQHALADIETVAVITHVAPDGDAIGSTLALVYLLREQGKMATPVCQDPAPYQVNWLPHVAEIQRTVPPDVEALISIDLSDPDRMGKAYDPQQFGHLPLINIDHHATNTLFGTINWVEPQAVAACEMVYHLARSLHWPITPRVATYILTGLLTDTRGLRTANVNARVMHVATHLVELGAPIGEITELTFNRKPLSLIKLWALALPHLRVEPEGIIWTFITETMRREAGHKEENDGGLVSFITTAEGMLVGIVFTEKPDGRINISFRSRPGIDVSRIAFALGGGGHPQASGATIDGPLDEAIKRVLTLVKEILQPARA